ncbi:hypothetical protein KCU61_g47, partial [Aureobasidium melanogenum]
MKPMMSWTTSRIELRARLPTLGTISEPKLERIHASSQLSRPAQGRRPRPETLAARLPYWLRWTHLTSTRTLALDFVVARQRGILKVMSSTGEEAFGGSCGIIEHCSLSRQRAALSLCFPRRASTGGDGVHKITDGGHANTATAHPGPTIHHATTRFAVHLYAAFNLSLEIQEDMLLELLLTANGPTYPHEQKVTSRYSWPWILVDNCLRCSLDFPCLTRHTDPVINSQLAKIFHMSSGCFAQNLIINPDKHVWISKDSPWRLFILPILVLGFTATGVAHQTPAPETVTNPWGTT